MFEMDSWSQGKVSIGVPSGQPIFTFVPVVQKLPFKSTITEEEGSEARTGKTNQNAAESHEKRSAETMSKGDIFNAEIVFIKDAVAGGAGSTVPAETEYRLGPSEDHMSLPLTEASPSVSAQPENTPHITAAGTASMETAVDKHRAVSQRQCPDTSGRAEVSSGCCANRVSEDRTSPTCSADLFPTMASSRESLLSDVSDKDNCWSFTQPSSVTSPVSFSHTASPCSSVRSGMFTPSVTQIKRHFLAPGSSLVHIPQTCFSSCESLFSSICPQSPPPPPRHRPPLTRLSLLTAILRKGRLPVLSAALQRPYTPCWPVNPVTLSFCNACSAASSVASIPLEFSSCFSSSMSIDSQTPVPELKRCGAAPLPVQSKELKSTTSPQTQIKKCSEHSRSSRVPRWEQVISPPPVKKLSRAPLPLFGSNLQSLSPAERDGTFEKLQKAQTSVSQSPEVNACNTHARLKGQDLRNVLPPSPKLLDEQENSAPQKWNHPSNSSLSSFHLLSQKLSSPPVCPPLLQPPLPHAHTLTTSASPLPRLQNTGGRCESERSCPASRASTAPSQASHKAECLSPSRYTPISFLGWPSPASSPTPTPSPAPLIRDLSPSPSLSPRSATSSPRPGSGISDCSDREGKKRKINKIKLSYKSLAAIPTNTLLLDQQAIDEQVEREDSPCDSLGRGVGLDRTVADTHAEMCSPAQLRQQSEELYAVIDEVLANSTPASSRSSTPSVALQNNSTLPKSLGRETKYASLSSLHQYGSVDRKQMDPRKTKPGVIRPMTAIPRLTVQDEEEFRPNPFKQPVVKRSLTDNKMVVNMSPVEAGTHLYTSSNGMKRAEERKTDRKSPLSVFDLQITEPDEVAQCPRDTSVPSSRTEAQTKALETHF